VLTKEGCLVDPKTQSPPITRILLLGGGFAGIYTALRLEKLFAGRRDVEIVLVSRDNFPLMTPLMFEVCSGTLGASDCSISIREFLRNVRFVEASVDEIDLEHRLVRISSGGASNRELRYDHRFRWLPFAYHASTTARQAFFPGRHTHIALLAAGIQSARTVTFRKNDDRTLGLGEQGRGL